MANTKSAKRQAKKNIVKAKKNLARRSAIKSSVKKVLISLKDGTDAAKLQEVLRDAESKLARAKGKNTLHPKTASRKVSRLAKKVAAATRAQQ
jgi:small subunit ribosomal protein S20